MTIRLGTPIVELHKRTTAVFGNAIMLATWGNGLGLIKKASNKLLLEALQLSDLKHLTLVMQQGAYYDYATDECVAVRQ